MNKFRIYISIFTLLLAISIFGFIYSIQQDEWYAISTAFVLSTLFLIYVIIRYTERWKRNLAQFIQYLQNKDFNVKYSDISKSQEKYLQLFNEIIEALKKVRIERELHYRYLQNVFEHDKTALICYSKNDKIELMNNTACIMLGVNKLSSLKQLDEVKPGLFETVKSSNNNKEALYKLNLGGKITPLSIKSTSFKLMNQEYYLVSLIDISMELDIQEMDSWKKLIRVLTHEIMNSVTPITSLTSAMQNLFQEEQTVDNEDINDIRNGLDTIEKRSKGLLKFVDLYRQFYRLPEPKLSKFKNTSLVNHIKTLMAAEMEKRGIEFSVEAENEHIIEADFDMLQHVLINLITNAMEACTKIQNPKIQLITKSEKCKSVFIVTDNGKGIEEENSDQIFIPFFSTKEGGSGIGLSLSRQIIQLHRGNITFASQPNKGSIFTVWLS